LSRFRHAPRHACSLSLADGRTRRPLSPALHLLQCPRWLGVDSCPVQPRLGSGAGRSAVPVNSMELIGPILILAVIGAAVVPSTWRAGRIALAGCAGALVLLPVGSTTVGGFMLAFLGPVSAATIMLCTIYLRSAILGPRKPHLPSPAFLLCIF